MINSASAIAHPNIAFIKYWGNRDDALRLPANGSVSMNLGALYTRTTVAFRKDLSEHLIRINGETADSQACSRIAKFLSDLSLTPDIYGNAEIISENNFPIGAGIASSASAFAALALAASAAAGLELSENELSLRARYGSGSACRSIPDGFCEWVYGNSSGESIAHSIAPSSHWDLTDLIAVVSRKHKKTGSSKGPMSALTSPFQKARVDSAPGRIGRCREAILNRDFAALAEVSEQDMIMMHGVMMTQDPPLFYWEPVSLELVKLVREWREEGMECFATLDAGPNVHVICTAGSADPVRERLEKIPGVDEILCSGPGGKAVLI